MDLFAVQVEGPGEQPVGLQVEDAGLAFLVSLTNLDDPVEGDAGEGRFDRLDDPRLWLEERQRLGYLHHVQAPGGQVLEFGVVGLRDVERQALDVAVVLVG